MCPKSIKLMQENAGKFRIIYFLCNLRLVFEEYSCLCGEKNLIHRQEAPSAMRDTISKHSTILAKN
jgi:hypothetical protein